MSGLYSVYNWCYQTMWLCSGVSDDWEDDTGMETHGANTMDSTVKSLTHVMWTEDNHLQLDAAHVMILIGKPWTLRRWSESKVANRKQHVWIPNEHAPLIHSQWTQEEPAKLKTLVARLTSHGALGVWRVLQWRLACFPLVLGDMVDCNDVIGHWLNEWPLNAWVDSLIFWLLREIVVQLMFYLNLQRISHMTKMTYQVRRTFQNSKEFNMPSPVDLLDQKAVLFCSPLANFVIKTGG